MKNYLLVLLSVFIFESNAQITKDFTYLPSSYYISISDPEIFMVHKTLSSDSKVQKYATIDAESYDDEGNLNRENDALVTLYNLDHSLYKEVLVTPPTNYLEGEAVIHKITCSGIGTKPSEYDSIWVDWVDEDNNDTVWAFTQTVEEEVSVTTGMGFAYSTHLFNNDDNIEFMINWSINTPYITSDGDFDWISTDTLLLYNEDGDILYNFGSPISTIINYYENIEYLFKSTENGYVFIMPSDEGEEESYVFYSIGGGSSSDNTMNNETRSQSIRRLPAYPNPTSNVLTIPYSLESGERSELKVYNSNGKLQTSKIIDGTFKSLNLDVSNYSKGIYVYKYKNVSESFIVK